MAVHKYVFAVYAGSTNELENVVRLTESLRTFAGEFSDSPVWAYVPDDLRVDDAIVLEKLHSQGVAIKTFSVPESSRWFFYADNVFAAGEAETAADGYAEILIWLDEDSVLIDEPCQFALAEDVDFGYVPVMHNRSGSLLEDPPDPFWSRVYELLAITDDKLFPMVTPADKQTIRAYFHVGLMVVRPQRGILRRWVKDFGTLYNDTELTEMCRADANRRIFLHQTAIMGVVHLVPTESMLPLSERYNYPIFFEKQYGGTETFNSIENTVSVRCIVSQDKMGENWHERLSGPPDRITWLKDHF